LYDLSFIKDKLSYNELNIIQLVTYLYKKVTKLA